MTRGPYCSQKFWFLSVNAERRTLGACCSAEHVKIDFPWLAKNPGQLFNTDQLVSDRTQMLNGQYPSSCDVCYKHEDLGLTSRRTLSDNFDDSYTDTKSTPEVISLFLGTNCNLTCSYCCKEYSTAWMHDIDNNGEYFADDIRYQLSMSDKVILKLSQKELQSTYHFNEILDQLSVYEGLKEFTIAGGEPFLQNGLTSVIDKIKTKVTISTGLGVTTSRLESILQKIDPTKVDIVVSAENINQYYEFNRFGNTYQKFLKNLSLLSEYKFDYKFNSVLSNLTVFGFSEFIKEFSENQVHMQLCTDPSFMSVSILPNSIKEYLLDKDYGKFTDQVYSLLAEPTDVELEQRFCKYVLEFSKRRSLNLDIFPAEFVAWASKNV